MKIPIALFCLSCIASDLSADTKWIPLQPTFGETVAHDKNTTKPGSMNTLIENAVKIQQLMDKKNTKEPQSDPKAWFTLDDNTESN